MEKKESAVAQGQKECMELKMPSFVFVCPRLYADDNLDTYSFADFERATIYFLDKERKLTTRRVFDCLLPDIFEVDFLNIPLLKVYLENIMPKKTVWNEKFGWIVPLEESSNDTPEYNEQVWIHNLMFWESLIEKIQVGPLGDMLQQQKQLISKINEQTDSARNFLINKQYLQGGKWAMQDMYSMIMALTRRLNEYSHNNNHNEHGTGDNEINERKSDELEKYRLRFKETQNQYMMLLDKLRETLDELKVIESNQK